MTLSPTGNIADLHIADLHIADLHIADLHIADLHIAEWTFVPDGTTVALKLHGKAMTGYRPRSPYHPRSVGRAGARATGIRYVLAVPEDAATRAHLAEVHAARWFSLEEAEGLPDVKFPPPHGQFYHAAADAISHFNSYSTGLA